MNTIFRDYNSIYDVKNHLLDRFNIPSQNRFKHWSVCKEISHEISVCILCFSVQVRREISCGNFKYVT